MSGSLGVDDTELHHTLPFWWMRLDARALGLHRLYCWYLDGHLDIPY